jgi:hypothetical protein
MIAILTGCGGSKPTGQPPPEVSGSGVQLSQPITVADCTDWEAGSVEERLGTVRQLRDFAGGPVVGGVGDGAQSGRGAVLDDEKAYDLLETYCANEYARGFRLYKLYERAAAFAGQAPAGGQ